MTFNTEQNLTELGRCMYGCGHSKDTVYYTLTQSPLDLNSSCEIMNRDSPLCGKCKPGYSPLVYSYDMSCMNCTDMTYNWIKYIAVAYIPLTFFFCFVILFKFSGTSPLVRGFITICQGLVSSVSMRAYLIVTRGKSYSELVLKILGTMYGIWNLDFFRIVLPPICLDITPLQALSLDYAIAFYPLLLVMVTYLMIRLHSRDVRIVVCLWKPFHKLFHLVKRDWDFEGSVVKAFATFFMMSYLKILNVTTDLLVCSEKYTLPLGEQKYQVKYVLYYDASVEYLKGDHLYYGTVAILIGVLVVILPLVFIVIYSMRCFQKCLNAVHINRQSMDILINCYQGYYKDGTNGTRDFRFFSVIFFSLQIVIMGLFSVSKSTYSFLIAAVIIILYMFILLAVQPYKNQFKSYAVIDAYMLLTLSTAYIMTAAADVADVKASVFSTPSYVILGVIEMAPFMYMIGLIIWWFIVRRLKHKRSYFSLENPDVRMSNPDDLPDRIKNPENYEPQSAGLSHMSQDNQ